MFQAPCFLDSSGDGVVGALAGAIFRSGIEARSEFGEEECPEEANEETMGNSLQLRARDTGRPVPFTRPAWVDKEFNADDFGPYRPVTRGFFPDTGGFWQGWSGYPLNAIPSIVKAYRLVTVFADGTEQVVETVEENYLRNRGHDVALDDVASLRVEVLATNGLDRAQVYSVRVFS